MNNGEKTLARTKTNGTHMRVSLSTGIMVTEICMHQNLKENWIVSRTLVKEVSGCEPEVIKKEKHTKKPKPRPRPRKVHGST
ncbi:hypothetical protein C8R48DRAFT_645716 [Suillus tomentosus]|nr:hypothetical protein C8R48DRAFT_644600 [Suillus tomentosus]KAG1850114.1 hypothetical protein C8R48DRAFT_641089 [Suillus tomentosus]KAG1881520.1 hypothetical protein C8R48DRAFT_645716 [Suillus tomentosus]